jgi:hypothetical protein
MATPVGRPERSAQVPELLGPIDSARAPVDVDPPRDIGWMLSLAGAIGALLAAWMLFPTTSDGMWAGYWTSLLATFAILGSLWLRSTLPPMTGYAVNGLCGLGLILSGALHHYTRSIDIPMIAGGVIIIVGVALQSAGRRRA